MTEASRSLWDERFAGVVDEATVGCSGFGREYNRWLYRIRRRRFRHLLKHSPIVPAFSRVLDVGAGAGFYMAQWREAGATTIDGLDFSDQAIGYLTGRFPGYDLYRQDMSVPSSELGKGPYDAVSAFDVLFHLVDDVEYQNALDNISNALSPGGTLLLSENFVHAEHPRDGLYHFSRTKDDIVAALTRAGLELIYRAPMFLIMNAPDDSERRALRLWWRFVRAAVRQGETVGWLAGAGLYPVELVLTRVLAESPTTEMAICVKRADPVSRHA